MLEVFRVETTLGHGPYWYSGPECDDWDIAVADHRAGDEQHPDWREDGLGSEFTGNMIFGFASLAQMRAWFIGAERLFLATCGFQCSCYQVAKVVKGGKQLAFERKSATLRWQKPINHF